MNTRGSALLLGAAALALLAYVSTALGAGKITGIMLNPPDIKTCAIETITVNGTGKCGSVTVFFGDGNKLITLGKPTPFPLTFHHVYSKGGLTKLSVQAYTGPGSICTGKASRTVQVAAGPKPTITSTSFFSLGSQITPGAVILLYGQNFGDMPGQAWIHLKDWQTQQPVHRQLLYTDTHWSDTFVAGQIPDISGVLNQQATLTVVAQCGAVSNAATVEFTANIDVVDYSGDTSPNQNRINCSMTGAHDNDFCPGPGSLNFPPECGFISGSEGLGIPWVGLQGYHQSAWGTGGPSGNDKFWLTPPLQNGWVLSSTDVYWETLVGNGGNVSEDPSSTTPPGTSNPTLGVDWTANNCGAIYYQGDMFIIGPKGVPY